MVNSPFYLSFVLYIFAKQNLVPIHWSPSHTFLQLLVIPQLLYLSNLGLENPSLLDLLGEYFALLKKLPILSNLALLYLISL